MTEVQTENPGEDALWTVRKVLGWSGPFLRSKGSPSAQLDAEILLAHALKCQRIELYTGIDKPLSVEERHIYREFLKRRAQGEPIAYIIGTRAFWRYDFLVNKDVLIPRPDTETLVEAAIQCLRTLPEQDEKRVLDVGTGSGCLAISLAKEVPNTSVTAWDNSHPALSLAEENATRLGTEISFLKRNALDPLSYSQHGYFDMVVSNPPYIGQHEASSIDRSVLNFEPKLALFAENGGYSFYEMFAEHAAQILRPNGFLCLEVGKGQDERVAALLQTHGWQHIESKPDLSGIIRVVIAVHGGMS